MPWPVRRPLVKQDPQNVDLQSGLGVMYNDLGIVLEESKRSGGGRQGL